MGSDRGIYVSYNYIDDWFVGCIPDGGILNEESGAKYMLNSNKNRVCSLYCRLSVFRIFSCMPGSESRVGLMPFRIYRYLFEGSVGSEKFATHFELIGLEASSPIVGLILNLLLYYPLGYLLPILFPKLKPKHVILIGCLCSIATETTQYLLKMGWCETDDVIHNTLGTAIGVWMWHLQSKHLNKQSERD